MDNVIKTNQLIFVNNAGSEINLQVLHNNQEIPKIKSFGLVGFEPQGRKVAEMVSREGATAQCFLNRRGAMAQRWFLAKARRRNVF